MAGLAIGQPYYVRKNDGAVKFAGYYEGLVPHAALVGGVLLVGGFVHKFTGCKSVDANGVTAPLQGAEATKMIEHGDEVNYAFAHLEGGQIPAVIQVGGRRRRRRSSKHRKSLRRKTRRRN